jgi:hypothetical protein
MSKIRGKDFDKTVIIPPEEYDLHKHKSMDTKPVTNEEAMGGLVVGPAKGLSRWSVFFLVVIGLLLGFGIVTVLMQ